MQENVLRYPRRQTSFGGSNHHQTKWYFFKSIFRGWYCMYQWKNKGWFSSSVNTWNCKWLVVSKLWKQGSLYHQPKQCTIIKVIPQNYHKIYVTGCPPKMGFICFYFLQVVTPEQNPHGFCFCEAAGIWQKNWPTDPESWQLGSTESQHCVWASRRSVVARRPEKTVDGGETDWGRKKPSNFWWFSMVHEVGKKGVYLCALRILGSYVVWVFTTPLLLRSIFMAWIFHVTLAMWMAGSPPK